MVKKYGQNQWQYLDKIGFAREVLKTFRIDANYMKKEMEKITDKLRYKTLVAKNEVIE